MSHFLLSWIAAVPAFAAPFLLATTGLIINERAGVLNLGAEGIMAVGAVAAIIAMVSGFGALPAIAAACGAALLLTLLFALLVAALRIDQVLAGLVTFALGVGLSGFVGDAYGNKPIAGLAVLPAWLFAWAPPGLARFLDQDFLTYAAFLLAIATWFAIERTEFGLRLRAVGEDAPAADAAGVGVFRMRLAAVLAGGILCGIAGAHLALVSSQIWVSGMVAGRGWIAVALVTFSRWHPLRAMAAAILFGAVEALVPWLLSSGMAMPVYLIQMVPYVATIAVFIATGLLHAEESARPRDLGRPFLREERR